AGQQVLGDVEPAASRRDVVVAFQRQRPRIPPEVQLFRGERALDALAEDLHGPLRQLRRLRGLREPRYPGADVLPQAQAVLSGTRMGRSRRIYRSDTRPDEDGPRTTLRDAVVRRQQDTPPQVVLTDHS